MICGKYVKTWAEATHACASDMHMDSDYPYKFPRIVEIQDDAIVIKGCGEPDRTLKIAKSGEFQVAYLEQSSMFERIYNKPPHRFKMYPFKDDRTEIPPKRGQLDMLGGAS